MTDDARLNVRLAIAATGGVAATVVAVVVAGSGNTGQGVELVAIARGLMVAAPIAVGLWAWRKKRPGERFGKLLVAAGFGWCFTTLAESGDSLLYSAGRTAGWVVEAGLVYLVLAFPSGRLTEAVDRRLFWGSVALIATLYLPTVLLAESYPVPSPYTNCDRGCPSNAFFLGSEPQFVDSVLRPLREVLTVLLFLAVVARLARRWQGASALMRRTLDPVLTVASVRCVALAAGIAVRLLAPGSDVPHWLSWTIALSVPALAAAFSLGLMSWRFFSAEALQKLGSGVRASETPADLRACLSEALSDPSLRLYCWREGIGGGHWTDEHGAGSSPPAARRGQSVTEVRDGHGLVAAIVHDTALEHSRDFLDAVAAFALIALKNEQLSATLQSSLREIRKSSARIVATADRERRRIERDLHDGAQQRLVALRVQLELAEELIQQNQDRGLEKLHGLGDEIDATLDEIRALARGVYPPLLSDTGLAEALVAAAQKVPIAAAVDPDGVSGRYPSEVESAVYFCCLEAMQNASKHAVGAHHVRIGLHVDDDALRFRVADDGAGFDLAAHSDGAGLTNMRDRIAAVGGELSIASVPGEGTVVSGSVSFDEIRRRLGAGSGLSVRDRPA